ncbi:MAG: sulfatase [Akkermansiaceae bacterium]|jgi:arylsulfatase A-like enzyme
MKTAFLILATFILPLSARPNVLFIAMDDLNDWIGCMGGNKQSITPNLNRLAASGQLFTNAHCAAPACNPSRSAIMTGISPHRSGFYSNRQKMREVMPDAELIPTHFSNHGYYTAGSGKILHYFTDAQSWHEYFPKKSTENPIPHTTYPPTRPLNLPVGGPWQYTETDWGGLNITDQEFGGDYAVSGWIGKQLRKEHEKPFFLACGIYRPHEPWFVPQKYFDKFPLENIQLPPGYKANDLDDLPSSGKRRGPNRYFPHIQENGQWKQGIQGYLASINFADAMLGRVLDALENGPNKDKTIVILWSDHGWHLGEKEHWQKYTAWRACTRIPLMIRVPKDCSPALPSGTTAGTVYDHPVSLLSLYATAAELCGLPAKDGIDSKSLLPALSDSVKPIQKSALTILEDGRSVGISAKDWRYIRYKNGEEELYHIKEDPYEWTNLAPLPGSAEKLAELRREIPSTFAPVIPISSEALPEANFIPFAGDYPASPDETGTYRTEFFNQSTEEVEIFKVGTQKELTSIGKLGARKQLTGTSRAGQIWLIKNADGTPRGHFKVLDREVKALIK